MDRREADTLERLPAACGSTEMIIGECVAMPELRRGHQAGASVAAPAREHGMSERQVWRIIRG